MNLQFALGETLILIFALVIVHSLLLIFWFAFNFYERCLEQGPFHDLSVNASGGVKVRHEERKHGIIPFCPSPHCFLFCFLFLCPADFFTLEFKALANSQFELVCYIIITFGTLAYI